MLYHVINIIPSLLANGHDLTPTFSEGDINPCLTELILFKRQSGAYSPTFSFLMVMDANCKQKTMILILIKVFPISTFVA